MRSLYTLIGALETHSRSNHHRREEENGDGGEELSSGLHIIEEWQARLDLAVEDNENDENDENGDNGGNEDEISAVRDEFIEWLLDYIR